MKTKMVKGLTMVSANGWGLIRASNTQPSLVMRFEALTKEVLGEYDEGVWMTPGGDR
jgi:phosphomannomutase/phosphoglucomutase